MLVDPRRRSRPSRPTLEGLGGGPRASFPTPGGPPLRPADGTFVPRASFREALGHRSRPWRASAEARGWHLRAKVEPPGGPRAPVATLEGLRGGPRASVPALEGLRGGPRASVPALEGLRGGPRASVATLEGLRRGPGRPLTQDTHLAQTFFSPDGLHQPSSIPTRRAAVARVRSRPSTRAAMLGGSAALQSRAIRSASTGAQTRPGPRGLRRTATACSRRARGSRARSRALHDNLTRLWS
jgi:hypothetical protein